MEVSSNSHEAEQELSAVDAINWFQSISQNATRPNFHVLVDPARSIGDVRLAALCVVRRCGDEQPGFLVATETMGFGRILSRYPRQRPDGFEKPDLDTFLTMDVWGAAVRGAVDVVVPVTADSDFVLLVERLVDQRIEVWVVGPDGSTAWEMIVTATHFVYARDVPGLLQALPTQVEGVHFEQKVA